MDNRFSIRSRKPADFFSPKSLLIKLNGLTSPFHYQVRSNRVMAFRNWLNLMGHFLSFFKCCGLGLFLRLMRFLRFRSRLICAEFDDPTNESLDLGHYRTTFSSNPEAVWGRPFLL